MGCNSAQIIEKLPCINGRVSLLSFLAEENPETVYSLQHSPSRLFCQVYYYQSFQTGWHELAQPAQKGVADFATPTHHPLLALPGQLAEFAAGTGFAPGLKGMNLPYCPALLTRENNLKEFA